MPGERGRGELQAKAINHAVERSYDLTKNGILSFRVVTSPTEGLLFCGEERITKWAQTVLEREGLGQKIAELQMMGISRLNHHSTRSDKLDLLRLLHQTSLPPLSSDFNNLNNFDTIRIQFSKMMNIEVQGLKFKWGGEIPEKVKEWLDEAWYEAFKLLRGQNYEKALGPTVKQLGFSKIADFFKALIRKCYSLRLGGEHNMHTFHTDLSIDIVRELLADKPDAIVEEQRGRLAAEEQQRKLAEEQQRMRLAEQRAEEQRAKEQRAEEQRVKEQRAEEQRVKEQRAEEQRREHLLREERSQSRGRSRSIDRTINRSSGSIRSRSNSENRNVSYSTKELLELLTPGILKTMHSNGTAEGETRSKYLQLLDKEVKDGLVVSMTMGDGQFISSNIFPADNGMAKAWMDWPLYCMVELNLVSIHKDKLIINHANATIYKVTEQPFASPGVAQLEFLTPQALQFWGIKFPSETHVNLSYKPIEADLNATLLTQDRALSEVSTRVSRPVTSVLTEQKQPSRTFSTSSSRSNHSSASHPSGLSPAMSPILHVSRDLSTARSDVSQFSISNIFTGTKKDVSSSRVGRTSSESSQNSTTRPTPLASQIPLSSQSHITSKTPATSQTPAASNIPATSQTPSCSQTPLLSNVDRLGGTRYKCPLCAGHKTFREEILYQHHMYNHHGGL